MNARTLAAIGLLAPAIAGAQSVFPSKPIRIVVPYPPGGANDVVARIVGEGLTKSLKQQANIDNRGGAGGIIGTQLVADSAPDGHTLLFTSAAHAINPALYRSLPYDSVNSFETLTLVGEGAYVLLTHPAIPAATVKELVALAKRRPGQLTFASAGIGNATHLAGELLKVQTGADLVHVPYKGGGPAVVDLLGGQVSMYIGTLAASLPYITAKRLNALAVTSRARSAILPQTPTMAEAGYAKYEVTAWWMMLAPKSTPPAIVNVLNQEIARHLRSNEPRDILRSQGIEPVGMTTQQSVEFLKREIAKWGEAIRAGRITVQ